MVTSPHAEDHLATYIREIHRYPLLTQEQHLALARRYRSGDRLARATMICANLRLVLFVAPRYRRCGLQMGDLIGEGNIGLVRAVDRFDPDSGYMFSTRAVLHIKGSIRRALSDTSRFVRVPCDIAQDSLRFDKVRRRMEEQMTRSPTYHEVCDLLGFEMFSTEYDRCRRTLRAVDLNRSIESLGAGHVGAEHAKAAIEEALLLESRDTVRTAIEEVGGRMARVVRSRFGIGSSPEENLSDIARAMGKSRERVRQIEARAIRDLEKKLRPHFKEFAEMAMQYVSVRTALR